MKNNYKYMAFGITNQCKDNYLIPFFDYDSFDLINIERELHKLQRYYSLSTIYIIQSTNGFNAFSFDKITFDILKNIYLDTKYVDKAFIKYGLQRGFMTLRMGKDKLFFNYINSCCDKYKKSNAHKKFFINIMNFPINDFNNFDDEKQITITSFPSNIHGFKKEVFKNGFDRRPGISRI